MEHIELANTSAMWGACFQCGDPNRGVIFDAWVEQEGYPFLCDTCITQAYALARMSKARQARLRNLEESKQRDEERRRLRLEAEERERELHKWDVPEPEDEGDEDGVGE